VLGDKFIEAETGKLYNKGGKEKVEKGVGFPTCVSVNNVVGHFSPAKDDESKLAVGDLIKIDLGAHLDGYLAVAAHSFVLGEEVTKDRRADAIVACNVACELAHRMLRPGNKSNAISKMLAQVVKDYKVELVGGIVSHQMERFTIDGEKVITNKPEPEQKPEVVEFAPFEVYAIDIVFSTGEGRVHEVDKQTTVFKRAVDETYKLKLKASRTIFSEINKRFPTFPFTLRELDSKTARFGIKECVDHGLVTGYPVLCEKNGEFVAHAKFTALVLPNQTQRITGLPFDAAKYSIDKAVTDEDLKKLLATSATGGQNKKKKKKKKAEGAAGDEKAEGVAVEAPAEAAEAPAAE